MNLQPVTNANENPFTFECRGCGRRCQTDKEPTFADLDGPSFRAYYCQACKSRSEVRPVYNLDGTPYRTL